MEVPDHPTQHEIVFQQQITRNQMRKKIQIAKAQRKCRAIADEEEKMQM